jgi:hypothetical protein
MVGAAVVVGVVNILAVFQVLASLYLEDTKTLFAAIIAIGGYFGVYFVALAVGDSWAIAPEDEDVRRRWQEEQWLKGELSAQLAAWCLAGLGVLPVTGAILLRGFLDLPLTSGRVNGLTCAGLGLGVVMIAFGMNRTWHRPDGWRVFPPDRGQLQTWIMSGPAEGVPVGDLQVSGGVSG